MFSGKCEKTAILHKRPGKFKQNLKKSLFIMPLRGNSDRIRHGRPRRSSQAAARKYRA
jgi:hypothetical protein